MAQAIRRIVLLLLVVVMILSSVVVTVASEEREQDSNTPTTATLYRYRDKQFTTSHTTSLYSDWEVYKIESLKELLLSYKNVIPTDIVGRDLSYWKDLYSSPDYIVEFDPVPLEGSYGYSYNTRKDGSGTNIYRPYKLSSTYGAYPIGCECYDSFYGTVYYMGTVPAIYDFCVYTTTKYYLWKWGEWSSWSETPYTSSETREVETKETNVLYRYREKQFSTSKTELEDPWVLINTTEEYEHSGFRTIVLEKDEAIDSTYCIHKEESVYKYVNDNGASFFATPSEYIDMLINNSSFGNYHSSGEIYIRYTYCTIRELFTFYHYYMWSDWSDWSYTPKEESDTVEVETKVVINFSVIFDANGGTGAPEPMVKNLDEILILSTTVPVRENYQFLGWATSPSGEVVYEPGGEYVANENITLYAVWKAIIIYTVTYDANGGTGAPAQQEKTQDSSITISSEIPVRDGYSFCGWSTSSTGSVEYMSGDIYQANESVTLYAVWKIDEYLIVYDANGGTNAPEYQVKLYGENLVLREEVPAREGYTFLGWSTKRTGEPEYFPGDSYVLNTSVVLYAVWEINTYPVVYHANNGSGVPEPQTKTHGVDIILSTVIPTREGYLFVGWSTVIDGEVEYCPGDAYTFDKAVTLYAVWKKESRVIASGVCGEKLIWKLTEEGTLTIQGEGDMYTFFEAPWYSHRMSIISVVIESGATSIGQYAFYECCELSSVSIPGTVKVIGGYAFYCCENISAVHIPDSVTNISGYAFAGCLNLSELTLSKNLTEISAYSFVACNSLTDIVIPDSVTNIGYKAFSGCEKLSSVDIGNGVKTIDGYAFADCSKLYSIWVGSSLALVESEAFMNCYSLSNVYISDLSAWCNISYEYGMYSLSYYAEKLYLNDVLIEDLVIPEGVTSISKFAFYDCEHLSSITFPDSVITIGEAAFDCCPELKSVKFGTGIANIEKYAFGSQNLKIVDISDLAAWCRATVSNMGHPLYYGADLYLNGSLVKNLIIPNGVEEVNEFAFYNCGSLLSVVIPGSVTRIEQDAFYSCDNLETVVVPSSVTSIGSSAFDECKQLASVIYCGTEGQWASINIESSNSEISNATRIYHSWDDGTVVTAPTCTQQGEQVLACVYCGLIRSEKLAPLSHSHTYTDNGDTHTVGCNNCDYSVTEGHTYENGSCACGAKEVTEPVETAIKFGYAVSFDSDLKMNYRIKLENIAAAIPNYTVEGAYLTVEKDQYFADGTTDVDEKTLSGSVIDGRLVFTLSDIQSVEMGSELRAVLHIFDTEGNEYYTPVDVISIKAYAQGFLEMLSYETNPEYVTMLIDLLNYGSAAQTYFGRRADVLANAGMDAYQQYATKKLSEELNDQKTVVATDRTITAVNKISFSVNFNDKTEMNAKLTLADGYTAEDITCVKVLDAEGNVVDTLTEGTLLEDGKVQFTYYGVKSVQLREMYYFVAYVGEEVASDSNGYSVEAYCKGCVDYGTEAMADMGLKCMYYGDSAYAYFN